MRFEELTSGWRSRIRRTLVARSHSLWQPVARLARQALLAALFGAGALSPALAERFCDGVGRLMAEARAGFPGEVVRPEGFDGSPDCRLALQLDGKSFYCAWAHPLRSGEARAAYARIEAALAACLGPRAAVAGDRGVNHPDTYEARSYQQDGASVTVALKDKAALGRSFVFLRVGAAEPATE